MNKKLSVLFTSLALSLARYAEGQTTAFTYQGKLTDGANPATGLYDMTFSLFDTGTNGSQVGSTLMGTAMPVTNGLLTTSLDFGSSPFNGSSRWLQIGVKTNGSASGYTVLTPRTALTPTPYAIYAQTAGTVPSGAIGSSQLAASSVASANLQANSVTSAKIASASVGSAQLNPPLSLVASAVGGALTGNQAVLLVTNTAVGSGFNFGLIAGGKTAIGAYSTTGNSALLGTATTAGTFNGNVVVQNGGNVGIGTSDTSSAKLVIDAGTGYLNPIYLKSAYNHEWALGPNAGPGTGFGIYDYSAGATRLRVDNSGKVGIGTPDPQTALHVASPGQCEVSVESMDSGSHRWSLQSSSGQSDAGGAGSLNASFQIIDRTANAARIIIYPNGTVSVPVLQITGGADVAEPFHMPDTTPKGAVVVIDEENPGHLKISDHAYDSHVAGIVSGADGINPGLSLHQEGVLEGGQNVALSGRVKVLADASNGPIKPGDLLTTSHTPGHCMKVANSAAAQGAIVGKAMSSLKSGKGMVLVLVSLQ